MKTFKISTIVLVAIFTMSYAATTFGAVSPEEAAKLGTTLTAVGAETAGNKEGTIPAYTGGLRTPPANFKPGSGIRPDPFAGEKPLFSINAKNMSEYADKLTEGARSFSKSFLVLTAWMSTKPIAARLFPIMFWKIPKKML